MAAVRGSPRFTSIMTRGSRDVRVRSPKRPMRGAMSRWTLSRCGCTRRAHGDGLDGLAKYRAGRLRPGIQTADGHTRIYRYWIGQGAVGSGSGLVRMPAIVDGPSEPGGVLFRIWAAQAARKKQRGLLALSGIARSKVAGTLHNGLP